MRKQAYLWIGSLLGALAGAPIGYLIGRYVIPQTDLKERLEDPLASALLGVWLGLILFGLIGFGVGLSLYRRKRRRRHAAARRRKYAQQIAQHDAEQEAATQREEDEWDRLARVHRLDEEWAPENFE